MNSARRCPTGPVNGVSGAARGKLTWEVRISAPAVAGGTVRPEAVEQRAGRRGVLPGCATRHGKTAQPEATEPREPQQRHVKVTRIHCNVSSKGQPQGGGLEHTPSRAVSTSKAEAEAKFELFFIPTVKATSIQPLSRDLVTAYF